MNRETLDSIGQRFGAERFTVGDYIGRRLPQPGEAHDVAQLLQRGAANGYLVPAPGPRGGTGYRLSDHQFKLYQGRADQAAKREARDRARFLQEEQRRRAAEIARAVTLLRGAGYQVIPPAEDAAPVAQDP